MYCIWHELPFTGHSQSLVERRSKTPQFALKQIQRAADRQDPELFQHYADIDTLVRQVHEKYGQIDANPLKDRIITDIASGKSKIAQSEGRMVLLERWVLGNDGGNDKNNGITRLGTIDTRHGKVYALIPAVDIMTGSSTVLSFVMEKSGGGSA